MKQNNASLRQKNENWPPPGTNSYFLPSIYCRPEIFSSHRTRRSSITPPKSRRHLECADMSAPCNWETCLPVGKRRRVAALQTPGASGRWPTRLPCATPLEKFGGKQVFTFHRAMKSAPSFVSAGPKGVGTHLNSGAGFQPAGSSGVSPPVLSPGETPDQPAGGTPALRAHGKEASFKFRNPQSKIRDESEPRHLGCYQTAG